MKYSDESYNLRIELDTKDCELSAAEIERMEQDLDPLARVVKNFPVSVLYLTIIHHPRSNDYHVKTALVLSGKTLFTGDRDETVHPAYIRCLRKLVKKVHTYKDELENVPEFSKQQARTHQDVLPTRDPDLELLQKAVEEGDYRTFRRATDVYEEPIRKRIGRWVQRYPDLQAEIDNRIKINDIVEEVFLNAFERFEERPDTALNGEWLEQLIEPSIEALVRNPDEEFENLRFARTLTETEEAAEADENRP